MGEIAIVTGYTGTAHVKSMHDRSRIAGVVGTGAYVLPTGNKLKAEMQNANTVRVLDGDLVLQGCHATIEAGTYQDLKIDNGTQGMKRHDLVVARYERRAQDPKTESVTLKIVKGTPAAAPKDPAIVDGSVLAGALVSEVALWRIPLDGLNVGDPVPLIDVVTPMSELAAATGAAVKATKIVKTNVTTRDGSATVPLSWPIDVSRVVAVIPTYTCHEISDRIVVSDWSADGITLRAGAAQSVDFSFFVLYV